MPRYIKILCVLLFAVAVGFLIAEGSARLIFPSYTSALRLYQYIESERGKFARYDPLLGWAGKEDVEGDFEWIDARHRVAQNRYGFRGKAYPFKKSDTRRMVVLGDSFVWGFGVENEDIFTSMLEVKSRGRLEVVNLGVSGYGTGQEFLLWKELGSKWSPDTVLLFITPITDLGEVLHSVAHGYPKPQFILDEKGRPILKNTPVPERSSWEEEAKPQTLEQGRTMQWLLAHSTIISIFSDLALKNASTRKLLESWGVVGGRSLGDDWDYLVYMKEPSGEDRMGWKILLELVGEIDRSASEQGAELKVVIVPSMLQVYPEIWTAYTSQSFVPKDIELDVMAPNKLITAHLKTMDIEVVDLASDLKAAGEDNPYLYFPVNRHWTREGNRVVMESLWKVLKDDLAGEAPSK